METRTYQVYTWDELSQEGKDKALERYRYFNVDNCDWFEFTFDYMADDWEMLKDKGIKYKSCSFSGFCDQGDGASVEYEVEDKAQYTRFLLSADYYEKERRILERYLKWSPDSIDHNRTTERRRGYSNYTSYYAIEFETNEGIDQPCKYLKRVIEMLNCESSEHKADIDRDAYKLLKSEYESLTSDESIIDCLVANEYKFSADGEID